MQIPKSWQTLQTETRKDYFQQLVDFVDNERREHTVFPPAEDVFAALDVTPASDVRVLLLGQDPYHGAGQAHGLCFSVSPGIKIPPSLRNIFKELNADIGCAIPENGCLTAWARQGVLLLNSVLTVRENQANSHRNVGWETFTDAIIRHVNDGEQPIVFVLWGKPAERKMKLIDAQRHAVIVGPHPSPLSAYRGFFGSRPFSHINAALKTFGHSEIDWTLT